MRQTQRMAYFVGCVLAAARHGERQRAALRVERRDPIAQPFVLVEGALFLTARRGDGPCEDVVVGERAVRFHAHRRLDDLARAWIDERRPDRVVRIGAVHPLDHVVARVHGVHVSRHVRHAERILESRRCEHRIPPHGAVLERAAVGLGDSRVEVVDDRLHRLRYRGGGILLDQPVADGVAGDVVLVERLREIVETHGEQPDARIELARLVSRIGQLHEREMLAQRHEAAVGRVRADREARLIARERERRLELGIPGERLGVRQVHGALVAVELEAALGAQRAAQIVDVGQEIGRHVHEHPPAFGGQDVERRHRREREGLPDRACQRVVRARGPELRVLEHQQHFRPHPFEARQLAVADRAAVDSQARAGVADPGCEGGQEQEVLAQAARGNLQQHAAVALIPVDREVAVALVERCGGGGDRRRSGGGGLRRERCGEERQQQQSAHGLAF